MSSQPLGLYVHWPYCARVCPYCDFNVVRDRGGEKTALAGAILADLGGHAALTGPRRLTSIFFGGGTPSLMEPGVVAAIVDAARVLWTPAPDLEVTLEANPTDAESDRFTALTQAGVNRLSLGLQSLDDAALKFLGRDHDAADGRRAAARAARAFPRLSIDLIYARPGQSVAAWTRELGEALTLGAEHISPYQLTIEPGTAFHRAVARGTFAPPPPDLAADLYETTQEVLGAAGFEAYEVSNHARGEAARSRHNLIYWRGGDYVGVGPGAHGRLTLGEERWASVAPGGVADYMARVNATGLGSWRDRLDGRAVALERLLMGLRTVEGVALSDLNPLRIPPERIEALGGFIDARSGRLAVTAKGRPVLNRLTAILADGA
ncbi:MAG: radical SAM family heme chaperone HemW [Caulobacteraceae bacterium]